MSQTRALLIAAAIFCLGTLVIFGTSPREPAVRAPKPPKDLAPREIAPQPAVLRSAVPVPKRATQPVKTDAYAARVAAIESARASSGGHLTEAMFQLDPQDVWMRDQPFVVQPDSTMFDGDNRPEQREWRATWSKERHDDDWTQRMAEELRSRATDALQGKLEIVDSSCRETLCLIHLQFEDELDAKAFQGAEHPADYHYEYQTLDPRRGADGYDNSDYGYELIVKRETDQSSTVSLRNP